MNTDSARFVGDIPQHYDTGMGPIIFADYAADTARRAAAFRPGRVLEIAAGTGIVTRRLRDALPSGVSLTATDFNAPMLEIARKKFGSADQIDFQTADATQLPFAADSFDAIVCQFGLMFFPDKDKAHREAHRVLSPGGAYLLSVWDRMDYNPYSLIAHEVVGRLFPADPPQFYTVPFSCAPIDPIKESLIDAGFSDITISVLRLEKEIYDTAAFARGLVYGNPAAEQIRSRQGAQPQQVFEAILQEIRRAFGDKPARMPLQAIIFSARKL
ncbi:class I SAM-dependent methyltransferase [Rhizobium calliandrae]|uniref:Class I SAM-dependent methyltransferase n=1 Tax=Rhizobium calliandrae TaxID=1312182 RepID=A0ABT7KA18_9HYPH|nr:class I SAM-dependent methyltransferase [Rhizobium calliandrae]MDL2405002.1 class I SAM-dependent methyltransferase [Rhizobium calliandrae]